MYRIFLFDATIMIIIFCQSWVREFHLFRDSSKKPSAMHDISKRSSSQVNTEADDFDDFDPRGSSTSGMYIYHHF